MGLPRTPILFSRERIQKEWETGALPPTMKTKGDGPSHSLPKALACDVGWGKHMLLCRILNTVTDYLAIGTHSEKGIPRCFRHRANSREYTYTNLNGVACYTPRLHRTLPSSIQLIVDQNVLMGLH